MLKADAIKVVAASSQNGIYTRAREPVADVVEGGKGKDGKGGAGKGGNTQSKAAKKAQAKADKEVHSFFFVSRFLRTFFTLIFFLKAAEFGDDAAEAGAE